MIIHNLTIRNFKSCYGEHKFNFDKLQGLIKLSGPIGSGKTTILEAILYCLFGTVKGQNNTQLISWNTKTCEVEINLTSKGKEIRIVRNVHLPLIIEVDGKPLVASSKRNAQEILEEELYDVPKLAIIKMCIISFNAFNSLAAMNPAETKQFLDEIFGFKLFSDYNEEIILEKKNQVNEQIKLNSIYEEKIKQIENLKNKQIVQTNQLKESLNIDEVNNQRQNLVNQGIKLKQDKDSLIKEQHDKVKEIDQIIKSYQEKMTEYATLGKQAKNHYNTFKTGKCPTCGHDISQDHIQEYKDKMNQYATLYRENEAKKKEEEQNRLNIKNSYIKPIKDVDQQIEEIRTLISKIDANLKSHKDSVKLLQNNYNELIKEYEDKAQQIKDELDKCDLEIGEWNEMGELFTKTLRYNLLETLIPHINKSIQFFINKLDQSYKIKYDQEFKAHIFVDAFDREIAYNNLSTGQRKSLDLAIIFGILQNVIASVNFNVFVLDELFSNMDSETRNTMLSLLNETMSKDKSIFIINHAEMSDDYFQHKIRVTLENKSIVNHKTKETVSIKSSKYNYIF